MMLVGIVMLGMMLANSGKKSRDGQWRDHGMKKRRRLPNGSWETRKLTLEEENERRDDLAW